MIQFNLLPTVKLEYIKARRTKRLVIMTSCIVTGVALAIVIMLFVGTNVLQKQHLDNLDKDIKKYSADLSGKQDLNKILTIQNQLGSINGLHDKKPVADRLGTYLPQLTPNDLSIDTLDVDFTANTMNFEGAAPGIDLVNKFIDTLKFTVYKATSTDGSGTTSEGTAFSEVVMADFTVATDITQTNKAATYTVKLKFDPVIFSGQQEVQLNVPNIISTRSTTQKPNALFEEIKHSQGTQ